MALATGLRFEIKLSAGLDGGYLRNFDVTVGADKQLKFCPDNVKAKVGDTLTFSFFPKNHSVVQSDFAHPCKPLNGHGGIFSGFVPVNTTQGPQNFVITVKDEKPLWLYCAQTTGNHCQAGMAMVVNEPAAPNTLAQYKENAKLSGISEVPPAIGGGVFQPNPKASSSGTAPPSTATAPPPSASTVPAGCPVCPVCPTGEYKWSQPSTGNGYKRARAFAG
ncbi:uncharacterized protein KY384_001738 [Bacidia gigantensis]|uniref:uncharacterized protein n=1 Tax=Bacidia gigantensis TaxID=2732470 RepID=UPI001D040FD9|nr:uncharacterized protein KY384_001738 [Bacidia gigantensis]KAG8532957.1 hypothetical protein KY384_001738 [Bacidia gigantensis]